MQGEFAILACIAILLAGCSSSSTTSRLTEVQRTGEQQLAALSPNALPKAPVAKTKEVYFQRVKIPTSPWTDEQIKECPRSLSVSTTSFVSCTACANGSVMCWGEKGARVLSVGMNEQHPNSFGAQQIVGISDAISVSTNSLIACALHKDGRVSCWGSWKQTSIPFVTDFAYGAVFEVPLTVPAISVSVGYENACALLQTGEVVCWGENSHGQCGVSNLNGWTADRVIVPRLRAKQLALGGSVSCAIDRAGHLWCWGSNDGGGLATGDSLPRIGPVRIEKLRDVVEVRVSGDRVCAQTLNGDIWCWGIDYLGHPDGPRPLPTQRTAPIGQLADIDFESFSIITPDGRIYRLSLDDDVITEVPGLSAVQSLSGYSGTYCAVMLNGDLRCWGNNTYGQLIMGQKTPEIQ